MFGWYHCATIVGGSLVVHPWFTWKTSLVAGQKLNRCVGAKPRKGAHLSLARQTAKQQLVLEDFADLTLALQREHDDYQLDFGDRLVD